MTTAASCRLPRADAEGALITLAEIWHGVDVGDLSEYQRDVAQRLADWRFAEGAEREAAFGAGNDDDNG